MHVTLRARSLPQASPAGKDATDALFGLYHNEVLNTGVSKSAPSSDKQNASHPIRTALSRRLQCGSVSRTDMAEPGISQHYTENYRKYQKDARKFYTEIIEPEVDSCEESGETDIAGSC